MSKKEVYYLISDFYLTIDVALIGRRVRKNTDVVALKVREDYWVSGKNHEP